jgi:transposase
VKRSGLVTRRFRSLPIGGKAVLIELPIQRLLCISCGKTRQARVDFADQRLSYTHAFERYILELSGHMTIKDVAVHLRVGWDMVKEIQKHQLHRRFKKPRLKHLKDLAIDEISIGGGHRYLTVVLDLDSGAVVFVGEGKGADSLLPFWKRLRSSHAKIEAVATDMSPAYTAAVRDNLPRAIHVFDRFHVVKLFNEKFSLFRQELQREAEGSLQKAVLKGTRWLLLKNPENLMEERDERKRLASGEGAGAEQAAGDSLLHEGRLAADLGPTRSTRGGNLPRRLDRPRSAIGNPHAHEVRRNPCRTPQGHFELL